MLRHEVNREQLRSLLQGRTPDTPLIATAVAENVELRHEQQRQQQQQQQRQRAGETAADAIDASIPLPARGHPTVRQMRDRLSRTVTQLHETQSERY